MIPDSTRPPAAARGRSQGPPRPLQAVARPKRALFKGGDCLARPVRRGVRRRKAQAPHEPSSLDPDELKLHLVAVSRPHDRAQIADAVDETQFQGALACPDITAEQNVL